MIISLQRCLLFPRSHCKRQSPLLSGITEWIIGPVPFIPPTAAFGSMMMNSKITCKRSGLMPSTWKRPRFSPWVSLIKYRRGALLLVSDSPMVPEGVKTEESDKVVTSEYVENHIKIGIDSLKQLINGGLTVRHLRF